MPFLENKYLGLATVAIVSLATFGLICMNDWVALALTATFMGVYWFMYGDQ